MPGNDSGVPRILSRLCQGGGGLCAGAMSLPDQAGYLTCTSNWGGNAKW